MCSAMKLPYFSPYAFASWLDGFGKIALRNILPFENATATFSLFLPNANQDREIVSGERNSYCFRAPVAAGGTIVVVLVCLHINSERSCVASRVHVWVCMLCVLVGYLILGITF